MFLRKDDFFAWLDEYTRNRRNDLQRSQTAIPKRSEKIILDLSIAPIQPLLINVPFKSVTFVDSYYLPGQTSPVTISMLLDSDNTGNLKNAITLKTFDTFNQDQAISKCFLTWDSQPGIKAELIFLEDSQLYEGATKAYVTNPVTVTQGSYPWGVGQASPWDVTVLNTILRTAEQPVETDAIEVPPGTVTSWTIPDDQYWTLNISIHNPINCPQNFIFLNGKRICNAQEKGFWAWEWNDFKPGDIIDIESDPSTTGWMGFWAKYQRV